MQLLEFLDERITPLFVFTVLLSGVILWAMDRREMEHRGLDKEARLASILGAVYVIGIVALFLTVRIAQAFL